MDSQPGPPKKRGRGIDSFFKRIDNKRQRAESPTAGSNDAVEVDTSLHHEVLVNQSICHEVHEVAVSTSSSTLIPEPAATKSNVPYDIGNYLDKPVDDYTKYQLLTNPWQPTEDYQFPYSSHTIKGKEVKRYFSYKYLVKYPWLVFSLAKKGLFCKYCPFFATGAVGGGQKTVPLQKLVTKPLVNFKDIAGQNGELELHAKHLYHKRAAEQGTTFIQTFNSPNLEVINRVHEQRLKKIEENKERLIPIIETVIFLGRQNLPFRGHRDDGALLPKNPKAETLTSQKCDSDVANEGNFRELLRFRVSAGDKKLEEHLKSSGSNATYISKTTQNELITCCGKEISEKILSNIRASHYYSILFDETTDVSHQSQLSLTIRYVHNGTIREDFLRFVDAFQELQNECYESDEDDWKETRKLMTAEQKTDGTSEELSLTGKAIGQIILTQLKKKLKLPLEKCVGIGTDGCAVMLSEVRGAVNEVQKEATNAVKSPCFSHKLNNSLSRSSKVPGIRDAVSVMKEVIAFFKSHPKRKTVLMSTLGCALTSLCETRWVERHEGVIQFSVDLPKVIEALEIISKWRDPSTAAKAASLVTTLCNTHFIVSVLSLSDVLALTQSLSKLLQKTTLDLNDGAMQVANTISVLAKRREDVETSFSNIWHRAENLADELGVELSTPRMPRRGGRQIHRANHQTNTPEEYYRVSIYAPVLDYVLQDLRERFSAETLDVFQLSIVMPENVINNSQNENEKSIKSVLSRFGPLLPANKGVDFHLLSNELLLWREKWLQNKAQQMELPTTALDILEKCDKDAFPIIHELILVLATLPVSNATAERSFSTLRRLKTYLRSTMTENRLLGLALMHIHRHIPIDVNSVITRFSKAGKKRLEFTL